MGYDRTFFRYPSVGSIKELSKGFGTRPFRRATVSYSYMGFNKAFLGLHLLRPLNGVGRHPVKPAKATVAGQNLLGTSSSTRPVIGAGTDCKPGALF